MLKAGGLRTLIIIQSFEQLLKLADDLPKRLRAFAPLLGKRALAILARLHALRDLELCRQVGTRAAVDRKGRAHEVAPDLSRDGAAADSPAKRLVIVPADPDSHDKVARETDEERVAIILAGSRLAERGDRHCGAPARPIVRRRVEKVEHGRPVAPRVHSSA